MVLLKPPETAVLMVVVPDFPWTADTDTGEAEIAKSGMVGPAQLLTSAFASTEPRPVAGS